MTALDTALAYHRAWTGRDFDAALAHLDPDVVCDAPAGRLEGTAALRGYMEPFSALLTEVTLLAAFGDAGTAVLVYDAATAPVPSAPAAECCTVRGGRITHIRLVFDRVPFEAARAAATP